MRIRTLTAAVLAGLVLGVTAPAAAAGARLRRRLALAGADQEVA